ncbi:MAG: hypothetical protein LBK56_12595, partial [Gracilibacteraceae bacterium]|jgi:hypothetical protein|nr:hypothetical protein [Gracilibacteraceae bacterium]
MYDRLHDTGERLKKVERRLKTLDEHIRQSENFKNGRRQKAHYEKLYAEYKTARKSTGFFAERKAKKALYAARDYYESNRTEIVLYDAAERYLRDALQGHFDVKKLPPMTKWKEERAAKTTERKSLHADYYRLRDEVKNAEAIKRNVEQLTRADEPRRERI